MKVSVRHRFTKYKNTIGGANHDVEINSLLARHYARTALFICERIILVPQCRSLLSRIIPARNAQVERTVPF
jgi:hypothetical protein